MNSPNTSARVSSDSGNTEFDADSRALAYVQAMTLDEKISMVTAHYPVAMAKEKRPADAIPAAGYIPGIPRLGIPALKETDASLGVSNLLEMRKGDVATALPCALALASSWNEDLVRDGSAMIGSEAKAKGFHIMLAGGGNLTRDAWCGRNFEYFSEDVLLSGRLCGAAIQGVQSNHIVSTIKHFALNPQETGRKVMSANLDEAPLRESDLLAFQIAMEIGNPHSVMCGYNRINGTYASAHEFLLTDVLRRDWGFKGWVMSDWGAVHATVEAAMAGLDQESGQELDSEVFFGDALKNAVLDGRVPLVRLDQMVGRLLRGVIASGVLDHPPQIVPIDYAAHAEIARTAAEQGIVLLKNKDDALPLNYGAAHILIVGGHASIGVLSGGGSSQVRSVGGVGMEIPHTGGDAAAYARRTYHPSAPLHALRAVNPNARIDYIDGSDLETVLRLAPDADQVIVFAEQWQTESEDVETLSLPDRQDALIAAVAQVSRRTIVVLETGGPVLMPWLDQVDAVVQAWYSGQCGGEAIARVLFGLVNPSGRLPMTFPRCEADLPRPRPPGFDEAQAVEAKRLPGERSGAYDIRPFDVEYQEGADVGYRWYAREGLPTLFPFGFGLSYTQFTYSELQVLGDAALEVAFTVKNTGQLAGSDVPQIYAAVAIRNGAPVKRLVGWQRVTLSPGESTQIRVWVDPRLLAEFDVQGGCWRVREGRCEVNVGRDAESATLTAELRLATHTIPA